MKRARLNTRKLLIASAGVATVNYALATGCSNGADAVANLMAPIAGSGGSGGSGPGPVANLVAPPPPMGGSGGGGGSGGFTINPSVANLVAPPPAVTDASVPGTAPADAAPADAAPGDASDGG